MNKYYRYFNLLKNCRFGFDLPRGALSNYLKLRIGMRGETIGNGKTYPSVAIITSVNRCNLSCPFCALGVSGAPKDWIDYELTPKQFTKILELKILKKLIVICFSGGEPLLNKDLPELMSMARKKGHLIGMISNGLLLEDRIEELVHSGLCDMQLSVYEYTKEKLSTILPKVSAFLPINASYVLQKSKLAEYSKTGFEELLSIINMCKESGCASIKFNIVNPLVEPYSLDETIMANDSLYDSFISICHEKIQGVRFQGYGGGGMFPSKKFTVFFPEPVSLNSQKRFCNDPWSMIVINAKGDFIFCCRSGIMGNLLNEGEQIINSDKARKIRACLLDNNLPLEKECVDCAIRSGAYSASI
jgi:sulfatase maturation enzyme AslB (radical SAM superfamily)